MTKKTRLLEIKGDPDFLLFRRHTAKSKYFSMLISP